MITAAAFSADGTRAVAGSYRGRLRFYEVEGAEGASPTFEYVTQLDVKNTSNQKRGKKITGLQVSALVGVDGARERWVYCQSRLWAALVREMYMAQPLAALCSPPGARGARLKG